MQGHDLPDLTRCLVWTTGLGRCLLALTAKLNSIQRHKTLLHWKMWSNALKTPCFLLLRISNFPSESKSVSRQNDKAF